MQAKYRPIYALVTYLPTDDLQDVLEIGMRMQQSTQCPYAYPHLGTLFCAPVQLVSATTASNLACATMGDAARRDVNQDGISLCLSIHLQLAPDKSILELNADVA